MTLDDVCEFVLAHCAANYGIVSRRALVRHFDITKNHAAVLLHRLYRRGRLVRVCRGRYMPAFGPLDIPTGPQDIPVPAFIKAQS